jgi:hypothetical protein
LKQSNSLFDVSGFATIGKFAMTSATYVATPEGRERLKAAISR